MRPLHNSLRCTNSMISKPVWFFGNRPYANKYRRFAKNQTGKESADLGPNGVMQRSQIMPLIAGRERAQFFLYLLQKTAAQEDEKFPE